MTKLIRAITALGIFAIAMTLNIEYGKTLKTPDGTEITEQFSIQSKFNLTLDKDKIDRKNKTAE